MIKRKVTDHKYTHMRNVVYTWGRFTYTKERRATTDEVRAKDIETKCKVAFRTVEERLARVESKAGIDMYRGTRLWHE